MALKRDLGLTRGDAGDTFDKIWEEYGFTPISKGEVTRTTPIQSLYQGEDERSKEQIQKYRGYVKRKLGAQAKASRKGIEYNEALKQVSDKAGGEDPKEKIMDAGEVEGPTPLVFDPEILSILKETSPLLELVPQEGQQGYKAVYNRIDDRDAPIGHVTEQASLDLLSQANDINFDKNEVDMTIYTDVAEISDFSQAAAEHYMNVQETTLAQRVQVHAIDKARKMLYATPAVTGYQDSDVEDGSLYDTEVYEGMVEYFEQAGNQEDKSAFSGTVVEDAKSEIADLQDAAPVQTQNLVAYTSHALNDYMENEVDERARHDSNDTEVNFGLANIRIDGVPVVPGHQVQEHNYSTEVISTNQSGDEVVVQGDLTATGGDGERLIDSNTNENFVTEDSNGNETSLTVSSISYDSGANESTVNVAEDVTSDLSGETARFGLRGSRGDIFLFSTRSFRYRALAPLSTVPLAKQGLSENVAMFEFGALVSKAEGAFGKHLSAYPQV